MDPINTKFIKSILRVSTFNRALFSAFSGWPFWIFGRPQRLGARGSYGAQTLPTLAPSVLQASVKFGQNVVDRLARLEKTLAGADVRVRPGSPSHGQLIAGNPVHQAMDLHKHSQVAVRASQYIADNNCKR